MWEFISDRRDLIAYNAADYIITSSYRDIAGTETFWRDYLHGFGEPSRLPERATRFAKAQAR